MSGIDVDIDVEHEGQRSKVNTCQSSGGWGDVEMDGVGSEGSKVSSSETAELWVGFRCVDPDSICWLITNRQFIDYLFNYQQGPWQHIISGWLITITILLRSDKSRPGSSLNITCSQILTLYTLYIIIIIIIIDINSKDSWIISWKILENEPYKMFKKEIKKILDPDLHRNLMSSFLSCETSGLL